MDEITEEPGALVERVAALDIGKATLTACLRVPHEDKPGARRQEVRTCATLTPALLELRDWLICPRPSRPVRAKPQCSKLGHQRREPRRPGSPISRSPQMRCSREPAAV